MGVWYDGLMFIFDGGILSDEQVSQIALDPAEAHTHKFLSLPEATERLRPSLARRIATAEAAAVRGTPTYAEFGRDIATT